MKKTIMSRLGKTGFDDPCCIYIFMAAGLAFLYMAFQAYMMDLYKYGLTVVCMLFLGIQQERRRDQKDGKRFLLSAVIAAWFLLLQCRRSMEGADLYNIGLFLSVYLFAFPLAALMQDGDEKRYLKWFAGAYLAAAAILSAEGLLLVLNRLPVPFREFVGWDGGRLAAFWHPNVAACFIMIGIVFGVTFLLQAKTFWFKAALSGLIALMAAMLALTSCRTAIIVAGGYLGSVLFFGMIRHGKKWFIPGVLAVLIVTVVFYEGAMRLYRLNYDVLLNKYTQQYSELIADDTSDSLMFETEIPAEDRVEPEETEVAPADDEEVQNTAAPQENIVTDEGDSAEEDYWEDDYEEAYTDDQEEYVPIEVDPDTGKVSLKTRYEQGSIINDFGTLNSRTYIWSSVKFAIRENPWILLWGVPNPGEYISDYNFFVVGHMHNAWVECLVGMGLVGFLIAVLFTLVTVWNCLVILLKHYRDIWKRNTAILALCLMIASILEPYLFYTTIHYHLTDILFFLCAGYLCHWQEADNRYILDKIRSRFLSVK